MTVIDTPLWPHKNFAHWPSGFRAAICLTWDVDDETPVYSRPSTPLSEASEIEQRRYGIRRGLPLIVEMLKATGVPAAFYFPAYMARQWAAVVRSLSQSGYEIGGHGYLHEPVGNLQRHQEEEIIGESLDVLRSLSEKPIRGYRTPSWQFNLWTPELLTRAGVIYDSSLMGDIAPYALAVDSRTHLIEIPIHWYWDDVEYWGHTQVTRGHVIVPPSGVLQVWKAELDGVVEAGGSFVLTLHPHVSGRPGLLTAVRQFVDYAKTIEGLWFTTPGEIADYVKSTDQVPTVRLASTSPAVEYTRKLP